MIHSIPSCQPTTTTLCSIVCPRRWWMRFSHAIHGWLYSILLLGYFWVVSSVRKYSDLSSVIYPIKCPQKFDHLGELQAHTVIQVNSLATSYQVFNPRFLWANPHQGAGHHVPQRGTWEIIASGIYLQASASWWCFRLGPAFSDAGCVTIFWTRCLFSISYWWCMYSYVFHVPLHFLSFVPISSSNGKSNHKGQQIQKACQPSKMHVIIPAKMRTSLVVSWHFLSLVFFPDIPEEMSTSRPFWTSEFPHRSIDFG